jgi:serine/threonine protein kinase
MAYRTPPAGAGIGKVLPCDAESTMSDSAYPDALSSQYRLHWYALERVLGQGGFGITYLARDTNLDQAVAIKEYLPVDVATRRADATVRPRSDDQAERYRWGLDRFIQEARTLARFDHPNIVRVLSVFEQNGTAYMVMRFEEGENFGALLERKRTIVEKDLMRVLLPVLDGLELVHNAGFIHRDIKPDNIHIRADGSPVLLDFGSARHSLGHARTVTILVAPGYAPFEQYYSSGEDQGPWTDIYSLGATCYRAVSGAAPMDAIARSKGILGSTRELLVPACAVGAGRYSERLLKAIDHALAFGEKDRPATIAQWRKELAGGSAAEGAPVQQPAAAQSAPPTMAAPSSHAPQAAPIARTAGLIALVAAIAVIGGGIGAYMTMRGAKPAAETIVNAAPEAPKPDAQQLAMQKAEQEVQAKKRADEERLAREIAEQEQQAKKRAEEEKQRQDAAAQKEQQRISTKRSAQPKPQPAPKSAPAPESRPEAPIATPPAGDAAAFAYYRGLALRGDADAAQRVGDLFETGRGTAPNPNWAYVWYSVAELRGIAAAKPKKEAMAGRLQAKEIEQADKLARSLAQPGK